MVDNGSLPDDFMSAIDQQLNIDDTPTVCESTRRQSLEICPHETSYGEPRDLEDSRAVSEEFIATE